MEIDSAINIAKIGTFVFLAVFVMAIVITTIIFSVISYKKKKKTKELEFVKAMKASRKQQAKYPERYVK